MRATKMSCKLPATPSFQHSTFNIQHSTFPPLRPTHPILPILLIFSAALTSCGLFKRHEEIPSEDLIRVKAIVKVEGVGPQETASLHVTPRAPVNLDRLKAKTFEAKGKGAYPSNSSGEVQRRGVARAVARRAALRALSEQILAFRPEEKGETMAELIAGRESAGDQYLALIETKSEVQFADDAESGGVVAAARIAGAAFAEGIEFNPPAPQVTTAGPRPDGETPLADRKRHAEEQGLEAARQQIYEQLLTMRVGGKSVRQLIDEDPEAARKLSLMLESVVAKDVIFSSNGDCEVKAVFDRKQVAKLFPNQPAGKP